MSQASPTATSGGTGPLVEISVTPYLLGNAAPRGFWVDLLDGSNNVVASTGYKLGTSAFLVVPAGTYTARVATRDCNGLWSETTTASVTVSNYTAGTYEGSIGSGALTDYLIQNPGFEWPDFSMGSGRITIQKTLVSAEGSTFIDEVRASRWNRPNTVFHLKIENLDQWQSELLQRFFRAVNGPQKPFLFDWYDPNGATNASITTSNGTLTIGGGTQLTAQPERHLVRFRDTSLVGKTEDVELTSYEVYLIGVIEDPEGGD